MAIMAQSMNRYAYANNNPLRFVDRNGHEGNALWEVTKGFGKGLFNIVAEPFREAADVVTVAGARMMGIDAEDVKLSSALGRGEQQAVLAGQGADRVAAQGIMNVVYSVATLGLGPLTENVGGNILAYYHGRITRSEYNERMGQDLSGTFLMLGLARLGENGGATPGEPELPFEDAAAVGTAPTGASF